MANGTPAGTFDKVLEAVKQLGVPIVLSGVLLYFHLSRVATWLEAARTTQLEMRAAQVQMQRNVDYWIAHGCQPAPPVPQP